MAVAAVAGAAERPGQLGAPGAARAAPALARRCPCARCTFSPGGGATCGSVRPNMATRSSRRESRLPFLFALVALLPPGALCGGWTQRLYGGRTPLPQDRGFFVVQGDPRELRLGTHGDASGAIPAARKPLRTRRSASVQPQPIQVYGQVSTSASRLLPTLSSPSTSSPPHPSFAVASQVQAPLGDFPAGMCFFLSLFFLLFSPTSHEYSRQHSGRIDLFLLPVDFSKRIPGNSKGAAPLFPGCMQTDQCSFQQVLEGYSIIYTSG